MVRDPNVSGRGKSAGYNQGGDDAASQRAGKAGLWPEILGDAVCTCDGHGSVFCLFMSFRVEVRVAILRVDS